METSHPRHSFGEWLKFRKLRLTGEIPFWWECDRRTCRWWDWKPEAGLLMLEAKREGMF